MKTMLASLFAAALLVPLRGSGAASSPTILVVTNLPTPVVIINSAPLQLSRLASTAVRVSTCPCGRPMPHRLGGPGRAFWLLRLTGLRPNSVHIQRCAHGRYFRIIVLPHGSGDGPVAGVTGGLRIPALSSSTGAPNRKGRNGRGNGEDPPPPGWTFGTNPGR
jgi:hypothetical protein